MKKLLKISLTLFFTLIIVLGFAMPLNPVGNWYQQFLPNIGGRTISDITFLDSLTGYSITSISSDTSYILKTTNSGDNWVVNFRAPSSIFRRVQFINNNTGYVSGQNLFKTTNSGGNWNIIYPSLFSEDMHFINNDTGWYADPNSLVGGVYRTTNGGLNWQQQLNIGSLNPDHVYFYNGRIGFISEVNGGSPYIRKTINSGQSWTLVVSGEAFNDIYFTDSLTGFRAYVTMKKTTDGGLSWVNQILPQGGIIITSQVLKFSKNSKDTIWGSGGDVFYGAGQFRGVLFKTTNGGNNWLFQVPDTSIHSLRFNNVQFYDKNKGWAYWSSGGVHTVSGGDTSFTGIIQINNTVPREYKLYQNYPNPFNPKTNIKYQILKSSFINIVVYDITGKQIIDLVNRKQQAGTYEVDFSGNGLSSGVYFYSLIADGLIVETKKLILIK